LATAYVPAAVKKIEDITAAGDKSFQAEKTSSADEALAVIEKIIPEVETEKSSYRVEQTASRDKETSSEVEGTTMIEKIVSEVEAEKSSSETKKASEAEKKPNEDESSLGNVAGEFENEKKHEENVTIVTVENVNGFVTTSPTKQEGEVKIPRESEDGNSEDSGETVIEIDVNNNMKKEKEASDIMESGPTAGSSSGGGYYTSAPSTSADDGNMEQSGGSEGDANGGARGGANGGAGGNDGSPSSEDENKENSAPMDDNEEEEEKETDESSFDLDNITSSEADRMKRKFKEYSPEASVLTTVEFPTSGGDREKAPEYVPTTPKMVGRPECQEIRYEASYPALRDKECAVLRRVHITALAHHLCPNILDSSRQVIIEDFLRDNPQLPMEPTLERMRSHNAVAFIKSLFGDSTEEAQRKMISGFMETIREETWVEFM